jgi:hypothetical protein
MASPKTDEVDMSDRAAAAERPKVFKIGQFSAIFRCGA